jgi:FkbM family methyltransferase
LAQKKNPGKEVVMIDVGANLGWYTLGISASGYRVLSFEPLGSNIHALRYEMCKQPKLAENILLFEYALGDNN